MVSGVSPGPAPAAQARCKGPATHGSPGPVGGPGPTGSCAGTSPGWNVPRVDGALTMHPSTKAVRPARSASAASMQSAARQRRGHQRQHLVASVGPPRRIAQVKMMINEFTQAQVLGQGGRKESPALLTRRWSSKAIWMRSGWLRGSIYQVLLVPGRFSVSKTIIPESQEHPLSHSTRRDTHLFGGLGFSNTTTALVRQCAHRQVRVPYGLVMSAVGRARTSPVPSDDPVPFRAVVALHRKRGLPCLRVGMSALILVDV